MIDLSRYSVKELEAELDRRKQEELRKASDYEIEQELSRQKHRDTILGEIKLFDEMYYHKVSECITNLDLNINDILNIDVNVLKLNNLHPKFYLDVNWKPVESIRITINLNDGTTIERIVCM